MSKGNLSGFDANKVEPNDDIFEPLPAGDYDVVIVASQLKPTSTQRGKGEFLELELQILAPEKFKNRKLWDRLNVKSWSEKAQRIAQGTLSSICRAVNVLTPNDSGELHDIPLTVRVKVRKTEEYGVQNDIASYKALAGGTVEKAVGDKAMADVAEEAPW